MKRLFMYKNTDYYRVCYKGKWYLSYSNEVVDVRVLRTFKELEDHEDYEELV